MNGYIKTLIIIIILRPVLSGIVYGIKTKKYIDFVIGLIIITLLITPLKKEYKKIDLNYTHNFEKMNYEDMRKQAVEKKIEDIINNHFNTNDADVILDENYNITEVKSVQQDKIKEYLGI